MGLESGWSNPVHLDPFFLRSGFFGDYLSSFFYPYLCTDQPGENLDAAHGAFTKRKTIVGRTNRSEFFRAKPIQIGKTLIVLRTIETFLPYVCGPVNQAFQISRRLNSHSVKSPVLTSYSDIDPHLPALETIGNIKVTRIPEWFRFMRYAVTPGMIPHLNNFDILHAHNYRNFQTDCGFFLPN